MRYSSVKQKITTAASPSSKDDKRIYSQYKDLVHLKSKIKGFSLLSKSSSAQRLSGRHLSKMRGRGLNFEEIRHYRQGDDIRTLDWKITLRTGKPHVRAYSEEKDLNVILCVDQRISMFFSSDEYMKSTVAAEVAALCGWKVLDNNDRLGAFIFNDAEHKFYKPQRNSHQFMNILSDIVHFNHELNAENNVVDNKPSFERIFKTIKSLQYKNSTFIFISDFSPLTDEVLTELKRIQIHNNVLCLHISDPMEAKWPKMPALVASDGEKQIEIDAMTEKHQHQYQQEFKQKLESLKRLMSVNRLPLISLTTNAHHLDELRLAALRL